MPADYISLIIKIYIFLLAYISCCVPTSQVEDVDPLLSPKIYAEIFKERRRLQQDLTKDMIKFSYEKKHKLLQAGYLKIFQLLEENNSTLNYNNYNVLKDGFQQSQPIQKALTIILENCCLSAEFLLHFPDISYRIFEKKSFRNWRQTLNWCIQFVNIFPHITDESSAKLMELLQQEIDTEMRTADYVNPYYPIQSKGVTPDQGRKHKKPPKKLKKGPQLSGSRNEL